MAGKIKKILDNIVLNQGRINPLLADIFKTNLRLNEINFSDYDETSYDDPIVLDKIQQLIKESNINLSEEINISSIAISDNKDLEAAITEIKQQFEDKEFNVIIYFASYSYNQEKISYAMKQAFKNTLCIGCSSVGEYANGKLYPNAIVAMGIPKSIVKNVSSYLIDNINNNFDVGEAFTYFKKDFNLQAENSTETFNYEKYVGILIMDGLSYNQDKIISNIAKETGIMFIGGASADNWEMKETYQYYNDKTYTNAAILLLIEPNAFQILKTESFEPTGKLFKATKVDAKEKKVFEFNNIPAAAFYADLLSVYVENAEKYFLDNTIGVMIGNEAYIHDPRCINYDDLSMNFYSEIPEGAELQLLKSINIIDETSRAINKNIKNPKEVTALINFNCASRTKRLERDNLELEHENIFKGLPMIGFSTYGEYYVSLINQTSTILILK